jgi:competence protein ComEC
MRETLHNTHHDALYDAADDTYNPGAELARLGAVALLGSLLGTLLQLQQSALWTTWTYVAIGLLPQLVLVPFAIKLAANRVRPRLRSALVLTAAAVAALGLCGLRASLFAQQALAVELQGRDLQVVGVVAAMPQRGEAGLRFRLQVESAQLAQQPVAVPPQLWLGWWAGLQPDGLQRLPGNLRAGERWQMTVRLKAPHGNRNPHGFDYELWLWEQGLQATGYVRAGLHDAAPVRLSGTWQHPVERARQNVRDAVFERVTNRQLAGILAALITGDQSAIERADWDVFRATGVAHLMSISGLHITLFAWAAAVLIGWLWRRSTRLCNALPVHHAALLGGVALAAAYALFSGWGVPAQRTVLMLATVALLRLGGLQWPWPLVWLLVAAVVAVADPWALMQAGFWLSFVAVAVLFATSSEAASADRMGFAGRLGALLREQWVVTVALTPLTLLLFGQVSLVGLLANLVAIPWVTLLVTPLALAGVAVAPLWDAAALAVQGLAGFLGWLASWSAATVSVPAAPMWAGVAGVLGGAMLVARWPWGWRLLGLPLLLPVLLWQAPRPAAGQFELLAADIGQGNAVIVRTTAHTLVYDAGPRYSRDSDAGHRVLVPLLRAFGERVDTVLLSHRDADHTGGAAAVLATQPQAALLSSIEAGHELQAIRPATRCAAGQRWIWDGVQFDVLHPQAEDYARNLKSNAISCVLRISNGAHTALLAGDIEQAQEMQLLTADAAGLKAQVLLVPHHGSKTSSSAAFLDAVQPQLALAQTGYRNRFGHPAPEVLQRYQQRGIQVVDSPACGAALWQSADPQQVHCERARNRRYWQQ